MPKSVEVIKGFIENIIAPMGYETLEVEFSRKYGDLNLTVYIGAENPITLDDCEKVHKAIDEPLDELNPTYDEKYMLNVSSYGIDRPLKTENDFKRTVGKEVEIALYTAQNGKKKHIGFLKSYDGECVVITVDGTELAAERKNVAKVKPYIRFE
ncbi:MAG: ribosome maturation factor RimP [Clostridiales bacterium]|jgi:ribosome maturation factor RimP|nr:ribosome maturation factor RimP [Clostridiales bacterium]